LGRYVFSVEEWHQMGRAGLFDEDARVELLEGEVTQMAPIGDRHALCVTRLARLFQLTGGDRVVVSIQNPVVLDDRSEPQPDLALLRSPLERYTTHPRPKDVFLLVEVADTTLAHDRDRKAPLYARSGIAETWIVDLVAEEVLMLRGPGPGDYRDSHRAVRGETVEPQELPGLVVGVDDVLGPPR
jgi:Uma2 family endonuclease